MTQASHELEIVYRISQALAHHHDVNALLQEVLDVLETELGMYRGTLSLFNSDTEELIIAASKGLTPAEFDRGTYKLGEGVTGKVAKSGKPAIIPDISADPDFLDRTQARKGEGPIAFLCVPIMRHEQLMGTMSIDRPSAPMKELETDMALLKILANILAEAVANIQEQMQEKESLMAENRKLKQELGEQYRPSNIIGNCASMRAVYNLISQVANSPATVLIRGESGTGKELVARALHYGSDRKSGPFVSVNCAALPENLIESELFGHEKGAFTGALQKRMGRFEAANGGTLFLDEIGDISPAVQVRLLRVLQERVFERVGGNLPIQVNVRVLAATSQNLETLMEGSTFREDLFYRLNVFPIHLPSLRERRSDIVLLADFFLSKYSKAYGKSIKRISTPAINMMMSYHWPGNVRELESCIERAVLTSGDDVIHGFNLPPSLQTAKETNTEFIPQEGASLKTLVDSYEREIIVDSLKQYRGNCAAAARALDTSQRIFNYRIRRHNIDPKTFKV